ncbi:MAG TPA: hypothetical protein VGC64_03475 [Pyrinomonadaceae bacterium]
MTTRRFVLHLIVGLLTFLIGVVAAIALGSFNPLQSLSGSYHSSSYAAPAQSLSDDQSMSEHDHCRMHFRARTAELRYRLDSSDRQTAPDEQQQQLAPVEPLVPLSEGDATPPPPPAPPRAPRPRH